jgi:hypothetical protein
MTTTSPTPITYTFPDNCLVAVLRNVTLTGGVPTTSDDGEAVVFFATRIQGKRVMARLAGKPDLVALVERYNAEKAELERVAREAFERNVPGIEELRDAQNVLDNLEERDHGQTQRFMDSGETAKPINLKPQIEAARKRADELAEKYPRAAVWLAADRLYTTWADNTGRGGRARHLKETIGAGEEIHDGWREWLYGDAVGCMDGVHPQEYGRRGE